MNLTKKSYEDYQDYVESIKNEYQSKEDDYGWKCKSYYSSLEDIITFIITNRFQTTKILYLTNAKIISTTTIYINDLEIINKLREGL